MSLEAYPDREILAMDVADKLASELRVALDHSDVVALAVAGGTTPGPVFDVLSAVDLDWSRVRVMPTDERWVAPDSERSNEKLIRERLLVGRAAQAVQAAGVAAVEVERVVVVLRGGCHNLYSLC